jgi:hypothetical protein
MSKNFVIYVTGYPGSGQGQVGDIINLALEEKFTVISGAFHAIDWNESLNMYKDDLDFNRKISSDNGIHIARIKPSDSTILHVIRDPRDIVAVSCRKGVKKEDLIRYMTSGGPPPFIRWDNFVSGWGDDLGMWTFKIETFYDEAINICGNVIASLYAVGRISIDEMYHFLDKERLSEIIYNYQNYMGENRNNVKRNLSPAEEKMIVGTLGETMKNFGYDTGGFCVENDKP